MNDATLNLLTDGEAADLLRMNVRRLGRMARRGEVPLVKLPDGELRFDAADLARWVEQHKEGRGDE